jgi:hypothetical protein
MPDHHRLRAVVATLALLALVAGVASAQTGSISGTVRSAATSAAVSGAYVAIYTSGNGYVTQTTTGSDGTYTVGSLAAGSYYVLAYAVYGQPYVGQIYPGPACPVANCSLSSGTPVTVNAGGTTSGINFALASGGMISGTVTAAAGGAALSSVSVEIYDSSAYYVGYAYTNASGVYTTSGLPTGTYYAFFRPNSAGYVRTLYANVPCPTYPTTSGSSGCLLSSGTPISVTSPNTTSGINAALSAGGSISGTVTNSSTSAAVANVEVDAYYLMPSGSTYSIGWATTNAQGAYSIAGLPTGSYYLRTYNSLGLVNEAYNNIACSPNSCSVTSGAQVSVTSPNTTSGIDFALTPGGTIAGTVRAASNSAGIGSATVDVYNSAGTRVAGTTADSSGVYSVPGLNPGSYYVRFSASGYLAQLYASLTCGTSCTITNGTPVTVTSAVTTSSIDGSLAVAGTITGTVTNAATSAPVASATVYVYSSSGSSAGSASTNSQGQYSVSGLSTGSYYVRTSPTGYLGQLYNGIACPFNSCSVTSGTAVSVTTGSTTSGINFPLSTGGSITGTVTDAATSAGVASATVTLYSSTGSSLTSTSTNAQGVYTISGIGTGSYYLRSAATGYITQVYNGLACPGGACTITNGTAVAVTSPNATSGINFPLAVGGTISGTVTNAATSAAVLSAYVYAYNSTGSQVGSAATDGQGAYSIRGLATGSYYLLTSPSGYVAQLYNGTACPFGSCTLTTGTPVSVTAGSTTGSINFALATGGTITGTVTNAATSAPVYNAYLLLYSSAGSSLTSAYSNAQGVYTISGIPTGTYYLRSSLSGYVTQMYNNVTCPYNSCTVTNGTPIAVTAPNTVSSINFALSTGATISGTVTNAATSAAVSGATVYVYSNTGSSLGSVSTNSQGQYSFAGLSTGSYYVRTVATGYITQLYSGIACVSCSVTSGTAVSVTQPNTTSGVNFALSPGATISGRVTDAGTSAGIANAYVYVYTSSGSQVGGVYTDSSGAYSVTGLTTGSYYVLTYPSGYVGQLYSGVTCMGGNCYPYTSGTAVSVTAPDTATGINFALSTGARISGRVTAAATATGIANAYVYAYTGSGSQVAYAYTDAQGNYSITGLATGSYYLKTNPTGYIGQIYQNVTCLGGNCSVTNGRSVPVTESNTTSGIDFSLQTGGKIEGVITNANTSAPLYNAYVYVYSNGTSVGYGYTNSQGAYSVGGLATGSYTIRVNMSGYVTQLYSGVSCPYSCSVGTGTPVSVTAPSTTSNINVAMAPSGSISGHVTNAGTSAAVPNAYIYIFDGTNTQIGYGSTDAQGAYTVTGLPAGPAYARTSVSGSLNLIDQVYSGIECFRSTCAPTAGTAISVAAGTTTPNVDFALATGGTITGTVTNAQTGAPVANAYIYPAHSSGMGMSSVSTNAQGVYTVTGLGTGSYYLRTWNNAGLVDEAYGDVSCPGAGCAVISGSPVAVTTGQQTANVNFALAPGGTIAGTVTNASTGQGTGSNPVYFYTSTGAYVGGVGVATDGTYVSPALPTGSYFARTGSTTSALLDQIYNGLPYLPGATNITAGTAVSVTSPSQTTGVNFALSPGGRISGTVTNGSTGAAVSTYVYFYTSAGQLAGSVYTNSQGAYVSPALRSGTYYVRTQGSSYVDEAFDDLACPGNSCSLTTGTAVTVNSPDTTTNVNFVLSLGGRIYGFVYNAAANVALPNVVVSFYTTANQFVASTTTGTTGSYYSPTLSAGSYLVRAYAVGMTGQTYPSAVPALYNNSTQNINFALTPSGGNSPVLAPTSGPAGGGTVVTIVGSGFVAGTTSVSFGSLPARSVTVNSSWSLTAVSPGGATGAVAVWVATPTGTSSVPGGFTYESASTEAPFGQVDTPAYGATGLVGAIGVTGWALDDVGVTAVRIFRNCLPFEPQVNCQNIGGANVVYIGQAAFLAGARPDVEAAFPGYPNNARAGWGYLMLTNMLPHVTSGQLFGGQGNLTLYAYAFDPEGHITLLGRSSLDHTPTAVTLANDTIAKPFGAIDTPGQGQTVSGALANFGWVLTPDGDTAAGADDIYIPTDGSTMRVYIDGIGVGNVHYNQCRGTVGNPVPVGSYCDDDVANIFGNPSPQPTFTQRTANPTRLRNLDSGRSAIGSYDIDTRALGNGMHTIAWGVLDSAGRPEGIGSRFFTVMNAAGDQPVAAADRRPDEDAALTEALMAPAVARGDAAAVTRLAVSTANIRGRIGFGDDAFDTVPADGEGVRQVRLNELSRLELRLGPVDAGYLVANGTLRDLPIGSSLDASRGVFAWAPGAGYFGTYDLAFVRGHERILVSVTIAPAATTPEGESEIRMYLDLPVTGQTVAGTFRVAGWALDPQAAFGAGIDAVHVWAQRQDAASAPAFLGVASLNGTRSDVGKAFGPQYNASGFNLTVAGLEPGRYVVTAYAWNRRTARWEDARSASITVR